MLGIGLLTKVGGSLLKNVGKKIADKLPGKKLGGQLFKKLVGSQTIQPTGQVVSQAVKEETMGQVDLEAFKRQDNETKAEHVNRVVAAASNAGITLAEEVKKPTTAKSPKDAAYKGAKKAVVKKYLFIGLGVAAVVAALVWLIKKFK